MMASPYDPGALHRPRRNFKMHKPRSGNEHEDPGQGATDRGSGPEFERLPTFNAHSGKRMVEEQEPLIASPGLQLDLKPEVLAQLQRIEGMLMGLVSLIDMTLPEKPIVIRKVEGNFVLRELKLDDD